MNELVSIIVPVYNVEEYLDRCIDSVVNQTYKKLEIILVDDGSPDNCPKMCDEWAKKDDRIIVIHKENGGLSSARNAGLDIMTGNYVYFLDSDDYIASNTIDLLYITIENNCCDMSFARFTRVDENDNYIEPNEVFSNDIDLFDEDAFWKKYYQYVYVEKSIKNVDMIISCNKLINRSVFDDLRFEDGRINEDEIIIHHIISKCKSIAFIDVCTYFYLQRDNSIMGTNMSNVSIDAIEGIGNRCLYFYDKNKEYLKYAFNHLFVLCRWPYFDAKKVNNEQAAEILNIYKKVFKKVKKSLFKQINIKEFILYYSFSVNSIIFRAVNKVLK